jgi:hypothetical protein
MGVLKPSRLEIKTDHSFMIFTIPVIMPSKRHVNLSPENQKMILPLLRLKKSFGV